MRRVGHFSWVGLAVLAGLGLAASAWAQDSEELAPYKMIRSLQYVQDTVVLGDHSAMEMQRYLLGAIDERLRTAEATVFDDPRNVDAALVYAMSGGNPATLDRLVNNDIAGHFDDRITGAVRSYLGGRGAMETKSLAEIFPEYRNLEIGPYLALISANSVIRKDAALALKYFDWARLTAPGTIVEEAALRRSIYVSEENGWTARGITYANRYARRFIRSPYASQFADLFVRLTVDHFEEISEDDILEILSFMDVPRQREVYLRMARQAAISGKNKLAALAADRAQALSGDGESVPRILADLYSGLATVPTGDVTKAMDALMAVPDEKLSVKDRALKAAARVVAEEVLRKPVADAAEPKTDDGAAAASGKATSGGTPEQDAANTALSEDDRMNPRGTPLKQEAKPSDDKAAATGEAAAREGTATGIDPAFDQFVEQGRSRLDEIDTLLKGEGS